MSKTPEGFVDVGLDVSDEQAGHLILAGLFTLEEDGILLITAQGSKWLEKWCADMLEGTSSAGPS